MASPKKKWLRRKAAEAAAVKPAPKAAPAPEPVKVEEKAAEAPKKEKKPARRLRLSKDRE
jgi:hypothetical protein